MESINVNVIDQDHPLEEEEEELSVTPLVIDTPVDSNEEDTNVNPTAIDSSIEPAARIQKTHRASNIIGEIDGGMTTRKKDRVDYKKMEELVQLERNDVWEMMSRPKDHNVIGTKWIFKNKSNELGNVIRNKAWLVAQGYT
ncbi:hypothetical protein LIER_20904 [Lithospermum erythrorhizon]|uniref:Reverse transcriptase Ty1/copia-type domain-containing protein n=1 Tax=Lithospermum erythrorhizon TaxID=34254 RepID=A0AAV3QP58_LITER